MPLLDPDAPEKLGTLPCPSDPGASAQVATLHPLHAGVTRRLGRLHTRYVLTEAAGCAWPDGPDISAAAEPAMAVGDALNAHDLDVYEPALARRFLKITNVRGVLADVMISPDGTADWEYRPYAGSPYHPGVTVAMVLAILDPERAPAGPLPASPGAALEDVLDSAAASHGIHAAVTVCERDETTSRVTYAEVRVTNPARPDRGSVLAADDGGVWWTCRIRGLPAGAAGLEAGEIAGTIARALAGSGCTRAAQPPAGPVSSNAPIALSGSRCVRVLS